MNVVQNSGVCMVENVIMEMEKRSKISLITTLYRYLCCLNLAQVRREAFTPISLILALHVPLAI